MASIDEEVVEYLVVLGRKLFTDANRKLDQCLHVECEDPVAEFGGLILSSLPGVTDAKLYVNTVCDFVIHFRFFAELQKKNSPPAICGKIFAANEPTYTCKDCAADPTCVFCGDCFRNSAHTQHNYRVSIKTDLYLCC